MTEFTAEILGRVPKGLTHNDVYATVWQMMNEKTTVYSCTKRQLAGNHVSVRVAFSASDKVQALRFLSLASSAVYNFSSDIIGLREVR